LQSAAGKNDDSLTNVTSRQDNFGGLLTSTFDAKHELTSRQFTGQSATLRFDDAYNALGETTGLTRFSDLAGTTKVGWTSQKCNAAERNEIGRSTIVFNFNANPFGQETRNHVRPNHRPLAHTRPTGIRRGRCGFVPVCGK
jgi:hypothetical protein